MTPREKLVKLKADVERMQKVIRQLLDDQEAFGLVRIGCALEPEPAPVAELLTYRK